MILDKCIVLFSRREGHTRWTLVSGVQTCAHPISGFITVPLYPTIGAETALYVLEHSEAKLLFVGKLDGISDSWNQLRDVLPASLPKIALPMSPTDRKTVVAGKGLYVRVSLGERRSYK